MAYIRKTYGVSKSGQRLKESFGHHRQLTVDQDPDWIDFNPIHEDLYFALQQFRGGLASETAVDRSRFKPEVAKKELTDKVAKMRKAFMTFIKKHVERADSDVKSIRAAIMRVTEAPRQSDPMQAVLQELRFQEIRGVLRSKPIKERAAFIEGHLDRIQAAASSPDDIVKVDEIRRNFAFDQDPDLKKMEDDTVEASRLIRKRAAEANATSLDMLRLAGITDDPLPLEEMASLFPGRTDYEKFLVKNRVQKEKTKADAIARKEEFEAKNEGVNLEAGARAARMEKGIPHG